MNKQQNAFFIYDCTGLISALQYHMGQHCDICFCHLHTSCTLYMCSTHCVHMISICFELFEFASKNSGLLRLQNRHVVMLGCLMVMLLAYYSMGEVLDAPLTMFLFVY